MLQITPLILFGNMTLVCFHNPGWYYTNPYIGDKWTDLTASINKRADHSAVITKTAGTEYMYVFGGSSGDTLHNDLWAYDIGMYSRQRV